MGQRKTYTQMYMIDSAFSLNHVWTSTYRKNGVRNYSMNDSTWADITWERLIKNYFDPAKKEAAFLAPMAEGMPNFSVYVNEQAWKIFLPAEYLYSFWQPWLKNYYGEYVGSDQRLNWTQYAWLDQEMKKAMGR